MQSFWVTHEVHQVLTDLLANWCSCPPTAAIHHCDLGLSDTICNSHFAPTFLLWYVNLTSLSKNIRPEDKQYFAQHALTESMQAFAASVGEVYEIDDGRHFEVAELALKGVGPDVFLHIKGEFELLAVMRFSLLCCSIVLFAICMPSPKMTGTLRLICEGPSRASVCAIHQMYQMWCILSGECGPEMPCLNLVISAHHSHAHSYISSQTAVNLWTT